VTANGNYVTKHAAGLYSTTPLAKPWQREEPGKLQNYLSNLPKAPFTETPAGPANIETYTIVHGKGGPEMAIVMGRLTEGNQRFVANISGDAAALGALQARDQLGRAGVVTSADGKNTFVPG
jgi:acetyl-CoA C-acetyltransferase